MSIYCTSLSFDDTWPDEEPAPLLYRRSHVLPSLDDPRGGVFDLAYIPGFITRGGRDDGPKDDEDVWPFLRVSLRGAADEPDTIVLDVNQVRELRDELNGWLRKAGVEGEA